MEQSGLKFLADECFSPVLIRILKHLGEKSIQPFKPNFEHGTPDEVWIPQATERGYICITLDRQMLSADKLAPFFVEAKARIIFIGKHLANATRWDQALWLLKFWRKVREHAGAMKPGQLCKVLKNSRIVPVVPTPSGADAGRRGTTGGARRRKRGRASEESPRLFD
jgi:hypothetical protein